MAFRHYIHLRKYTCEIYTYRSCNVANFLPLLYKFVIIMASYGTVTMKIVNSCILNESVQLKELSIAQCFIRIHLSFLATVCFLSRICLLVTIVFFIHNLEENPLDESCIFYIKFTCILNACMYSVSAPRKNPNI